MNYNEIQICIANIKLFISSNDSLIKFDSRSSALAYQQRFNNSEADYCVNYLYSKYKFKFTNYTQVFVGNLTTEEYLKYKWYIYKNDSSIIIAINYENHPYIEEIVATKEDNSNTFNTYIKGHKEEVLIIDPYLHPFGALLTYYLLYWNNGLLIHASCIINKNEAYAFTGVSGIGKSTMAKLWRKCGHIIINDDRLAIRDLENQSKVYNTPMPHYTQKPIESRLTKIFILKQHANNYIKPLNGVIAFSKVLSNFIQQFYEQEMIQNHLNIVESILKNITVYEVGFKPDTEIVKLIKELD